MFQLQLCNTIHSSSMGWIGCYMELLYLAASQLDNDDDNSHQLAGSKAGKVSTTQLLLLSLTCAMISRGTPDAAAA